MHNGTAGAQTCVEKRVCGQKMAAVKGLGIPIKLLHEGEGNTVTVELKNGEVYRGLLQTSEESMNCQMSGVTMTARDGRVSKLEQVYLRGSMIRFIILPESLKNAPMFKRLQTQLQKSTEAESGGRGGGRGRGRGRGGN